MSPYFGYDGGFGYDNFQGTLDNIRIYNRALSSTEVSDLYTLESQPFSHQPSRVVDETSPPLPRGVRQVTSSKTMDHSGEWAGTIEGNWAMHRGWIRTGRMVEIRWGCH